MPTLHGPSDMRPSSLFSIRTWPNYTRSYQFSSNVLNKSIECAEHRENPTHTKVHWHEDTQLPQYRHVSNTVTCNHK